ncbi:APC family permease [Dictyobacter arantiisoli]|uniref:Amino acid permease n=1 Tax=Dictyobacter arantiisoli TaxID=2014874 RepID=A0A5A5TFJ7_9CHLR|nr:APC family permease [Dictyobacter arantiisoli]GCF09916.1 amino acid permease [Dictyobacter arantiisoli]
MKQHDGQFLPSSNSTPADGDNRTRRVTPNPINDFALRSPSSAEWGAHKKNVRIVGTEDKVLRRVRSGVLEATEQVEIPHSRPALLLYHAKRILIGSPIASTNAERERLTKLKALAVLSSDAISSVAYATEAILFNLAGAGSNHLGLTFPISMIIIVLLGIVAISYRQTIPAYPNGGGSYIVAKENLGTVPGLVAAAALLIDYVLNVSVSVAAGVLNLASLFPALSPFIILLDVLLVILITVINLRGVRESGSILAFPTYFFVFTALLLIFVGIMKAFVFGHQPFIGQFAPISQTEPLTIFLLLRAFATGCSAMTGVEAISNGIPAFQKPETRNAATTLTWMAVILGTLFFGITVLAMTFHVEANAAGNPTVIAQIATQVFSGPLTFLFPIFQIATLGILILSAETSYSDFPRLTSLLARDKFLPSMFSLRGDRLAFTTGIIVLALLASILLVIFKGSTNALINLFAVGVFLSFTLSQTGMIRHWLRVRGPHWRRSMLINTMGALTTLLVALIISFSKFLEGAWIVILLIPSLVWLFLTIQKHYITFERECRIEIPIQPENIHSRLVVPINALDRAARQSLAYARAISSHVTAVHVSINEDDAALIGKTWDIWQQEHIPPEEDTHLLIIESPYRVVVRPLLAYIDTLHERHPDDTVTVVLSEYVVAHWWENLLHNQTTFRIKTALLFRPGIVVINVPQHLGGRHSLPSVVK